MGRFVDVGKGSKRRPENRQKVFAALDKLYGKEVQTGRFKQDPETGKMISAYEFHKKYYKPRNKAPFIIGDIEPYQSPIDDRVINSRRQQRYDLESNGCRIYEGLDQEKKVADQFVADKEKRFEQTLEVALHETARDLRYQAVKPETRIKSAWTIGEE